MKIYKSQLKRLIKETMVSMHQYHIFDMRKDEANSCHDQFDDAIDNGEDNDDTTECRNEQQIKNAIRKILGTNRRRKI